MKNFSVLIVLIWFCFHLFCSSVNASGPYFYDEHFDITDIDDAREYWQESEIGGISFRYQIGYGGYLVDGKNIVEFEFDAPFSGTLKQMVKQNSQDYSGEIQEIYTYDFEDSLGETLQLNNNLIYKTALYLEYMGEIIELGELQRVYASGYIYSDVQYNQLYDKYFLTRDISHLKDINHQVIIIDKTIEKENYLTVIEMMLKNDVILHEDKNKDFLAYTFGNNFEKYKYIKKSYFLAERYTTTGLNVVERKNKYEDTTKKYIEIPFNVYRQGELKFTILLEDREKYLNAGIGIENLFFSSFAGKGGDVIGDLRPEEYRNFEDFNMPLNYKSDEIENKFANKNILIAIMIVYLGLTLGFYFLYHKRLKRRSTIIYFSIINALLFFGIYFIWYKILLGSQNLSYSTKVYVNYPNFTLEKTYDYDFLVKRSVFHVEFTDEFKVEVQTNDNRLDRNRRFDYDNKSIQPYSEYSYHNRKFEIYPLKDFRRRYYRLTETRPKFDDYIATQYFKLNQEGKMKFDDFQTVNFDDKEAFIELPKPVQSVSKNYEPAVVEYVLEEYETSTSLHKDYIITVDYTDDTN